MLFELVGHLQKLDKNKIFADMILNAVSAWALLFVLATRSSVIVSGVNLIPLLWFVTAWTCYRGISFIHDVSHLHIRIPALKWIYNLTFGFFFKVPAYTHFPHQYHHHKKTYGTVNDPEYIQFTKRA